MKGNPGAKGDKGEMGYPGDKGRQCEMGDGGDNSVGIKGEKVIKVILDILVEKVIQDNQVKKLKMVIW